MEATQIKIHFSGRTRPITIVTSSDEFERLIGILDDDRKDSGFIELSTLADQSVWLNRDRIQFVNFLYEYHSPPGIENQYIKNSKYYNEDDDSRYDAMWDLDLFFANRKDSYPTTEIDSSDWTVIHTSLHDDIRFIVIEDEDGEKLAIKLDQIDLLVGTEIERYSPEQREEMKDLVRC